RADYSLGNIGGRGPCGLLRGSRRIARHDPESPAATAGAGSDGAPGNAVRGTFTGRESKGAETNTADYAEFGTRPRIPGAIYQRHAREQTCPRLSGRTGRRPRW